MSKKDNQEPDIKAGMELAKNIKKHQPKPSSKEEQLHNLGKTAKGAKKRGGVIGWLIFIGIIIVVGLIITGQIDIQNILKGRLR